MIKARPIACSLHKCTYTEYLDEIWYGHHASGWHLGSDFQLPFRIMLHTDNWSHLSSINLFAALYATFVIRFLIIVSLVIIVTRFYFWNILIHKSKIDTVVSSLVALFFSILHIREGTKVEYVLLLAKFVTRIFSSYSSLNWYQNYSTHKDLYACDI
jgi:hypothetical protein